MEEKVLGFVGMTIVALAIFLIILAFFRGGNINQWFDFFKDITACAMSLFINYVIHIIPIVR